MIAKKYRLKESEVKKVLHKGKPFFSYTLVLNALPTKKGYNRFAIVISWKSVKGSVERNYFRRLFYATVAPYIEQSSFDFVFVLKSKTFLDNTEKKFHEN